MRSLLPSLKASNKTPRAKYPGHPALKKCHDTPQPSPEYTIQRIDQNSGFGLGFHRPQSATYTDLEGNVGTERVERSERMIGSTRVK
jgi:hypothetical protein